MSSAVPETDRALALERAISARRLRASVKKDLSFGVAVPQNVLRFAETNPDSPVAKMRIGEFLISLAGVGPKTRDSLLEELRISPVKHLGFLGRHQRERLLQFLDDRFPPVKAAGERSRLLVLAGPTAVGKGTVAEYIKANFPSVNIAVSVTTRAPRPGEVDGVHYFFVSDSEFDRMVAADELLEYATVHNKYRYGTPRAPIVRMLDAGETVLLEIDIQGARQVRAADPRAILVFLLPPSWDELTRRLVGRGTEDAAEQRRRLATAKVELAAKGEFDYLIVNREVAVAAEQVVELAETSGSNR